MCYWPLTINWDYGCGLLGAYFTFAAILTSKPPVIGAYSYMFTELQQSPFHMMLLPAGLET